MQTQLFKSSGSLFPFIQLKGIQPSQTIVLLDSSLISIVTSCILNLHSYGTQTAIYLKSYRLNLWSVSLLSESSTSRKSSSQSSQAADHSKTYWLPTFILQTSQGSAYSFDLSFGTFLTSAQKMTDEILNSIKAIVHGYTPGIVALKIPKSSDPTSEPSNSSSFSSSWLSFISVKSVDLTV